MLCAKSRYQKTRRHLCIGLLCTTLFALSLRHGLTQTPLPAFSLDDRDHVLGSPYVPMDSWIYSAMDRLQALGYADTAFQGIRPWTRTDILKMLAETKDKLTDDPGNPSSASTTPGDDEAFDIYLSIENELKGPVTIPSYIRPHLQLETVYVRALGISGTPLRDSFHLGQTIANDYARPYQGGFNSIAGFQSSAIAGRFSLFLRAEYQRAPASSGYSPELADALSAIDIIPVASNPIQATIPRGPIAAENNIRIVEANLAFRLGGNQFSFGKSDHWLGPAKGGSLAYSNNAENIYAFQVDRTEFFKVPLLSRVTGPFRYLFFVGSLKGHTDPNSPWLHVEKISFKPTENLELGFERATIWGGKGHTPITVHTFLKSFFSLQNVTLEEKFSRNDPGARFGAFDFSYRLPFLRKWLTLYSDSSVHDDVSPLSAPRHAAIRPGLYLARFPHAEKLDLRAEAASSDPPTGRSQQGAYLFTEFIQRQGYTNKGFMLGDVIGRESKGGQAWLTYHLSPKEQVQLSWRSAKAPVDFIPGGTTQNLFQVSAVKRFYRQIEAQGYVQYERWAAPIYKPGSNTDVVASFKLTWYLSPDR